MTWFACDVELPHDRKVVELTDKFGAKGGWAWVCLMAAAKAHGRAGVVDISLRRFAADACLDSTEEAAGVLRELERLEVIGLQTITAAGATISLAKWQKYQQDALNQRRVARHRARKETPDDDPTITDPLPTGTGTTTETRTGTDVGSSSSRSVSLNDSLVQTVVARFEKAATSRGNMEVDRERITQVLHDFLDLIGLQGHALACAEWLADERKRDRRIAHRTLRNWLGTERERQTRAPFTPTEAQTVQSEQASRNTAANRDRTRHHDLCVELAEWPDGDVIKAAKELERAGQSPTVAAVKLRLGPSPLAGEVA